MEIDEGTKKAIQNHIFNKSNNEIFKENSFAVVMWWNKRRA